MNSGKLAPVRLAPVFVPRIWGARSLAPLFDGSQAAQPAGADPIGEVWLTGDQCCFATGEFAGRTLGETWPVLPAEWTGSQVRGWPRIPLLIKFLFPEDWLSVQVHPNDEYAKAHEGQAEVGKTEMWYAVAARREAKVRLGLEPGVTLESFRNAIGNGSVERCLRSLPVRAGDAFFVPSGTAHAIGPNMILCEIQQNSDITYRIFDYHRVESDGAPRELHIRQALEVSRFAELPGEKVAPAQSRSGSWVKTYLAVCPYFATERWEFSEPLAAATVPVRFELLIPISGRGRIECAGQSANYAAGELWLLPAALGAYQLVPELPTTLLRTFVPNIEEYARELASHGVSESARSQIVHRL